MTAYLLACTMMFTPICQPVNSYPTLADCEEQMYVLYLMEENKPNRSYYCTTEEV